MPVFNCKTSYLSHFKLNLGQYGLTKCQGLSKADTAPVLQLKKNNTFSSSSVSILTCFSALEREEANCINCPPCSAIASSRATILLYQRTKRGKDILSLQTHSQFLWNMLREFRNMCRMVYYTSRLRKPPTLYSCNRPSGKSSIRGQKSCVGQKAVGKKNATNPWN